MMPPALSAGQASITILRCRSLQSLVFWTDHSRATAAERNMPSPEHGTSATITSKKPGRAANRAGSACVTTVFPMPHLVMFSASTAARALITSFATRSPSSPISADRWVLLPPGAPHRSSTLRPLLPSVICLKYSPVNILDDSCG